MNRYGGLALAVFLLILFGAPSLSAQTGYRSGNEFGEARFAIEAVDFRAEQEGLHNLEIFYKIFYNALSYQKTAEGYVAAYEIAIIVEGNDGEQIEGLIREGDITVKTYGETQRGTDFVINLVSITTDEQDVTVRAILTDKLAGNAREVKKSLARRSYWGKYPTLSRVEFSREVMPATKESKFNKADYRVIPSVTRLFGGDYDTVFTYYQEIYPGETKAKYIKIISRIYSPIKGFVYADTIELGDLDEIQRQVHRINVVDLRPGDYELEVRLEGRRGKLYDKLIEEFELELTAETIYKNDYKTAIDMLKYLANTGEQKKLKDAKTDEERRALWDEFWALRGDNPNNGENPGQQEYFRRIRHSNRYFSYMKREGWKTTRGMIYVTYGEPDEVESYPFELSTKPYQIWLYYRLSPPRKFYFIDEWGDGNYELQPPYNGLDW